MRSSTCMASSLNKSVELQFFYIIFQTSTSACSIWMGVAKIVATQLGRITATVMWATVWTWTRGHAEVCQHSRAATKNMQCTWYCIFYLFVAVCGATYNNSLGFLFSPGYPDSYSPYQNCKWYINIAPNNYLRVTIQLLDIAYSDLCQTDYLQLDRGNFRYNGKLCGYHSLSYVINTGTTVAFHTEAVSSTSSSSGFLLLYKQLQPDEVTSDDIGYVTVDGTKIPYTKSKWLWSTAYAP